MKTRVIPYNVTTTFCRCNIPHFGHVELIEKMLAHGEQAYVYLSTAAPNNSWDLRWLMLKHLCRARGVDLNRVYFLKAPKPQTAILGTINASPIKEAALVLGEDQEVMGQQLSQHFDVPFIKNQRSGSSTAIRFLLDDPQMEVSLGDAYKGDVYAVRLAKLLRQEELNRERLFKASKQTATAAL